MTAPDTLSVRELSDLTGKTISHIRRLCRNGTLHASKKGDVWVIPCDEAMHWINPPKKEKRQANAPFGHWSLFGCNGLTVAIISQAVRDARKGDVFAHLWLKLDPQGFLARLCELYDADLDVDDLLGDEPVTVKRWELNTWLEQMDRGARNEWLKLFRTEELKNFLSTMPVRIQLDWAFVTQNSIWTLTDNFYSGLKWFITSELECLKYVDIEFSEAGNKPEKWRFNSNCMEYEIVVE